MSIIIMILKIIGIALLSLLALAILFGILVIFVPVRYDIKGNFNSERKEISVKVTWLLKIISFLINGDESGISKKITVFGFRVKGRKKDKNNIKKDYGSEEIQNGQSAEGDKEATEAKGQCTKASEEPQEDNERLLSDKGLPERKKFFQKFTDKIKSIIQKIKDFFIRIYAAINKMRETKDKIKEFITSPANKAVLGKIKSESLYLLKHFKPRKIYGRLLFGTGDPATTGWFLGSFYIIYPVIPGKVEIIPDFDEKVIEGNIVVKGRIRSIHALLTVVRLFSNKDFRNMLNLKKKADKK